MFKYILITLFLLTSGSSHSQTVSDTILVSNGYEDGKFHLVQKFNNNDKVYVMIEKRDGERVKLWVKLLYASKSVKNKQGQKIKSGQNYDMLHILLYCSERTYDLEKGIKYNADGKVLKTTTNYQSQVSIIPNTLFDYVRQWTCY